MARGPPDLDFAFGDVWSSFAAGPGFPGGIHACHKLWRQHRRAVRLQITYRSKVVKDYVNSFSQVRGRGPRSVFSTVHGGCHLCIVHLGFAAEGEVMGEEWATGQLAVVAATSPAIGEFRAVREHGHVPEGREGPLIPDWYLIGGGYWRG